jgi:hypothetical protein
MGMGTDMTIFETRDTDPLRYASFFRYNNNNNQHMEKKNTLDVHQHDSDLFIDSNHSRIKTLLWFFYHSRICC